MVYDPENRALEALETERDNLRVELAAARKVIAAGYGTCASCRHWTEDPNARQDYERRPDIYGTPPGDCAALDGFVYADGYEVEDSGIQTPPDFGCVSYVKASVSVLSLPPLTVGEAKPAPSGLVVTEHPFQFVHSNHVPTEEQP